MHVRAENSELHLFISTPFVQQILTLIVICSIRMGSSYWNLNDDTMLCDKKKLWRLCSPLLFENYRNLARDGTKMMQTNIVGCSYGERVFVVYPNMHVYCMLLYILAGAEPDIFIWGGHWRGQFCNNGELSMVCVGLSERDLLQWHDVTRKI